MTGIGARLVEAREARGLTLEDAERDTRISRRYLQALEDEEFDVIPAPVYARGFLRSYSQYVGLDPQEMLGLFPRDDEPVQRVPSPTSFSQGVGATSRPAWRRPGTIEDQDLQQVVGGDTYPSQPPIQERMPERAPTPLERPRPGPRPLPSPAPGPAYEPTIGVDIGIPARRGTGAGSRIKRDPAAPARSMTVAIVAIVGIVSIILVALLISRLGGGTEGEGAFSGTGTVPRDNSTLAGGATAATGDPSGLDVTPGVVPNVVGQPLNVARAAIQEAGYTVTEVSDRNAEYAQGVVFDQAPAAGTEQSADIPVTIQVSEGP